MCKTKTENVRIICEEEVLVLRSTSDYPKRLYAKLQINETLVQFQLDSGASVNVLPEALYSSAMGPEVELRPTESTLLMYDRSELETAGIETTSVNNPQTR